MDKGLCRSTVPLKITTKSKTEQQQTRQQKSAVAVLMMKFMFLHYNQILWNNYEIQKS
jgi:hypothetical protein